MHSIATMKSRRKISVAIAVCKEVRSKYYIYTLFVLLVWCAGTVSSQTAFDDGLYVTDGTVSAVVLSVNTI